MTVPSKAHTWTNWQMAQICQRVELQLVLGDSNAASPHTLAVSALAVQLLLPAHQVLLARPLVLAQHELTRKKFLNDNFNLGSLSLLCQGGKLVARGGKHSDCWLYLMHMAWQPAQLLWTLILVVASRNTRARMAAHTERDADEPRDVLAAVNDDAAHFTIAFSDSLNAACCASAVLLCSSDKSSALTFSSPEFGSRRERSWPSHSDWSDSAPSEM